MKNQQGSILVGILALSLVMTMAAGGFILLSGNTTNRVSMSQQNLQLHYAAEAGIHLAVRWTRNYPIDKINDVTWADPLDLTTGLNGYDILNGYKIKVTIFNGGAGTHWLKSFAIGPDHTDSLEITQQINIATVAPAPFKSTPALSKWIEIIPPGQ